MYAREIAFATAQVYAQAAEARGAWDARLESLVVNAVLSGEADEGAVSRAAALGWNSPEHVCVVLGTAPDGDSELTVEAIRRAARHAKLQVLTGVLGDRLVVIAGGSDNPLQVGQGADRAVRRGPGGGRARSCPTCWPRPGPRRPRPPGCKACSAWQDAPRPVLADDLLPERAIAADPAAREQLVEEIYRPLEEAGSALLETLECLSGAGEQPGGRRPDALRAPQHRPLPAATCDGRHRLVTLRCPLRVHAADRPDPGAPGRRRSRSPRLLSDTHNSPDGSSSLSPRARGGRPQERV